jgi:transposase
MSGIRKSYSPELKARVVLEALKEEKTMAELGSMFKVSPRQILDWKKIVKENLRCLFQNTTHKVIKEKEELIDRLYKQVGQLQVEYEWLKKKI